MNAKRRAWVPDRAEIITLPARKDTPTLSALLVASSKTFNDRTGIVIGFPFFFNDSVSDNPFAVPVHGPDNALGYALAHLPQSIDWRSCGANPQEWHGRYEDALVSALRKLDAICSVCPSLANLEKMVRNSHPPTGRDTGVCE